MKARWAWIGGGNMAAGETKQDTAGFQGSRRRDAWAQLTWSAVLHAAARGALCLGLLLRGLLATAADAAQAKQPEGELKGLLG